MKIKSFIIGFLAVLSMVQANAQNQIIFSSSMGELNSGTTPNLMMHDLNTSQTRLLLKGTVSRRGEYNAATSPDGKQIIFNTYRYSGWKLAIADFKNGQISNVNRFTNRRNYEYNPVWSNDGKQVAYQEFNWGTRDTEIFIKDMSTGAIRQFTNSEGGDRLPAWTFDDSSIVFTSGRSGNYEIYLGDESGETFVNLTNHESLDIAPSCSPTENKIAFLSNRTGHFILYTLNLDNNELKQLTSGVNADPTIAQDWDQSGSWAHKTSWSPNGKSIVFTLAIDGDLEIFVVCSNGSNLQQITENEDADFSPHWVR